MTAPWYVPALALAIDLAAGDPQGLPHPVRLMGWSIERMEKKFRSLPFSLEFSGLLFALSLLASAYLTTLALITAAEMVHPLLGILGQIMIIYTCLAPRCLYDEAMKVCRLLAAGDINKAREQVGMLVSRETQRLDQTGIARATIETVAENFVDGVLSPLFYATILGAPGAVAFKMVSTLDSMVGYKNERYLFFGKASARMDDLLNWVPARLSIPIIGASAWLMLRTGHQTLQTVRREGNQHSSPNAGKPEAAFAGALGIKINGPNIYHGIWMDKPWIGVGFDPPGIADIQKAAQLMMLATVLSAFAGIITYMAVFLVHQGGT